MNIISLFLTALIVGFSGAMMPGPLLTATINETYHKGFRAGPRLVLGHGILEIFLIVALMLGLGHFFILSKVKLLMAIIGGTFLLWMGIGIVKDSFFQTFDFEITKNEAKKSIPPEWIGVFTSISNPYWILWWSTIGLTYITLAFEKGLLGIAAFYLGHISSDFLWYSGVSFAAASGKKLLSNRIYQIILLICGIFLIALAIYFFYSGFRFIHE